MNIIDVLNDIWTQILTVTSAFVILPWREEMAPVISARRPGRSCPM